MQVSETNKPAQDIAVAFGKALAQSLSSACESTWTVALSGQPITPKTEDALYFRISFSGPIDAEMFFGIESTEVREFGFRGVPQADNESPDGNLPALQAALDAAAHALPPEFSKNSALTMRVERAATPKLPDQHVLELVAQTEGTETRVSMSLFFDEALVTAIENLAVQPVSDSAVESSKAANLDMVLDVELNVTLRFGQRQLSLREVLDLTSGSVVELDRQVDEPVDLFLDGKVVARGEAVIIDGNYGMRITQVLQPLVT